MDFSNPVLAETIINHFLYFVRSWGSDKELLIYAAIAVTGLMTMALALTCANPKDKARIDAKLELLRDQKEKAEHLARLKAEFLNQVSHELRTPLAVIIGYVECLTDGLYGRLDDKHKEILHIVSKQSGHLKNMIDQILIYSRLEASKQPIRCEAFDPAKVLDDLRETFDFLCNQKGIALRWSVLHMNSTFTNDPERFKEIASNLLQNAVKYTDRGSITVTFKESKSRNSVVLEVSDTGVGIPPGAVGNIFEPFIQVHKTSTENSRGGIGLGLSIVKKHTEQMQGHVSVVSDLSKGSTFKVIFPSLLRGKPKTPNNFLSRINARLKYRSRTKRQPGFDGIDRLPVTVRQKSHEQNSISEISTTS